ncbi:MAG: hypothetical protein AB1Z98_22005 [Nannocystaceae bacterium]
MATVIGSACSRNNPAYEDGTSAGGSASSTAATSTTITTTEDTDPPVPTGTDSVGDGSQDSGAPELCGNGIVDEGEDCDNLDSVEDDECAADCRARGEPQWFEVFEPVPGQHLFNGSALAQGDLIAVGHTPLPSTPLRDAVIVRYALEDGTQQSVTTLGEGFAPSEAYDVDVLDDRLYVVGEMTSGGWTAFAACFDVIDPVLPPVPCTSPVELAGARATAVDAVDGSVLVATSAFMVGGAGISELDPRSELVGAEWFDPSLPNTQTNLALVRTSSGAFVGGTAAIQASVSRVLLEQEMHVPWLTISGEGLPQGMVQALATASDDVIAGGWLAPDFLPTTPRRAFVGRYDPDAAMFWQRAVGMVGDDSEVEDLAVDECGDIIAVGMSGTPLIATVWKLDGEDGTTIWSRQYPELASDESFLRSVEVEEDIFVVGEGREAGRRFGLVLRLAP